MSGKPRIEDEFLEHLIRVTGVCDWRRGYHPSRLRKWEVDIVSVSRKISIEIEGRRHSTAKQSRSDSEKQNFLAIRGWRCFRYPASSVGNVKRRTRIIDQLYRTICNVAVEESDSCVLIGE